MKWRESKDEEGKGKKQVGKVEKKGIWKGESVKEEGNGKDKVEIEI